MTAAALLLADDEPETRAFLERNLPRDGFELVPASGPFDLVLAGDVDVVERWVEHAPVIVLGAEQAGSVACIRALRQGCDDYVAPPVPLRRARRADARRLAPFRPGIRAQLTWARSHFS